MLKTLSKYKTDGGQVFPVSIAKRTEDLSFGTTTNSPTALGYTTEATFKIRKDVSEFGITSRKVIVKWTGAVPPGYSSAAKLYIPVLTPELFAAIQKGQEGVYLGLPIQVLKKIKERIT